MALRCCGILRSMPSLTVDEVGDFSEVATGRRLEPVTPGDILLHEFMEPLGLSANALATALCVPANRITPLKESR